MRKRVVGVAMLLVLSFAWAGPSADGAPPGGGPLTVCVSCYPLRYFAERIGGDGIAVECPVPQGADPNFWMPDRPTVSRMQKAGLILVIGASYEAWLNRVSLPLSRLADTTRALDKDLIRYEGAITHSHGPAGSHSHEGIDPHTWLDPLTALRQAVAVKEALVKARPAGKAAFEAGFDRLKADLVSLDAEFRAVSAGFQGMTLVCSHPAYNYLGRRYGWDLAVFPADPEGKATPEELAAARELKTKFPVRLILWEEEPNPGQVQAFEGLGWKSVVFSPCESPTGKDLAGGRDFLTVMRENLARLVAAAAKMD